MRHTEKISYISLLVLIFLLPLFFLPVSFLPVGIAKMALITLGGVVVLITLLLSAIRHRGVSLPAHHVLWFALALPLVYAISATFSSVPSLSFFGYALEPGTTASIIILFVLFLGGATMFRDRARLIRALSVFVVALSILALFVIIKIISGGTWLTLGNFSGNMANPLGSWMDLAVIFGLGTLLIGFALEMLPVSGMLRGFLWALYILSVVILCVLNFSTAWILILGASIILFIYFITVEKPEDGSPRRAGVWMVGILGVLSLLFLWNPTIASKNLSTRIGEITKVVNTDVRPSFSATLDVSRGIVAKNPLFGSGPNTFSQSWMLYRPVETNTTAFWNVAFPFGFGFLPTAMASTGVIGGLVWALCLIFFVMLGARAVAKSGESKSDRFILLGTFVIALFLWFGAFLYVPSSAMLALTFIITGMFVGAAQATGVIGEKTLVFNRHKLVHFVSVLVMLTLAVGIVIFGFTSYKKFLGAYHFNKAVTYSNTVGKSLDEIEVELGKAINASPTDQYWNAVSQIELSRANTALADTKMADKEKQTAFQTALSRSIAALQNAITLNPNYSNWIALSNIYESLVPTPLSVEGAYEGALETLNSALQTNPQSPEVPLILARLELDKKNVERARVHIAEALNKKPDYASAYFFLAQLEVGENNLNQAIKSAETGVLLSPGNAGVLFELGLLKYSNQDYAGAVEALTKALAILPNYANAKYYLGLSLDKLGRQDEAIQEFEDLIKTNPDNELVTKALANLRSGKDALLQAPMTKPKAPPITGQ